MESLDAVAKRLKLPLSPVQLAQLGFYGDRLLSERRAAGLTSLSNSELIAQRHLIEPLVYLVALEAAGVIESPAIDIGTGAGVPGLPLKIARPLIDITLLEANGKKVRFVNELVQELRLDHATVVHARAEELGRDPAHRAAYRLAMARAVAPLRVLIELALPLLTVGGYLGAIKGSRLPREIREATHALEVLGGVIQAVESLPNPDSAITMSIVLVKKTRETPDRYPRRPGIPGKRPL